VRARARAGYRCASASASACVEASGLHVALALSKLDRHDYEEALRAISSTLGKCLKVKPKLQRGSPQHTLLVRRIKALRIAAALIERELR